MVAEAAAGLMVEEAMDRVEGRLLADEAGVATVSPLVAVSAESQ